MGQRIHHRRTNDDDNNDRVHDNDNYSCCHNDEQSDDKRNDNDYLDNLDQHYVDDDQQFLDDLYNLASRRNDNDNSDTCHVLDDRTYNYIVNLYATAIHDNRTTSNNDTSPTACDRCSTTSGGNHMAANYGIHTTDDDAYYHCSRNDCPCNDTNTVHVDLDRILDRTCGHDCCDTGTCDCACCDRACDSCS